MPETVCMLQSVILPGIHSIEIEYVLLCSWALNFGKGKR